MPGTIMPYAWRANEILEGIMKSKRIFSRIIVITMVLVFAASSSGLMYSRASADSSIVFQTSAGQDADNPGESAKNAIERISVKDASDADIRLIEKTERYNGLATRIAELYIVIKNKNIAGCLLYDTYSFTNGDLYYYLRYEPVSPESGTISVLLPYRFDTYDIRTISYPHGLDQTKSEIKTYRDQKPDNGIMTMLNPGSVYIDSEYLNAFFSYTSVFEKDIRNIRKELYEKAENIHITADGVRITLPAVANSFSEQWGIISAEKLVDWEDEKAVAAVKTGDLSRVRKWGGNGQYYFLPYAYAPYSPNGFYRNSANHIGNLFINIPGRFFQDYAYITIDTLTRTQKSDGFWGTDPMAVNLYESYKVGAGFFDTRWDTEAALSLLRGYRKFDEPHMLEAAVKFADFYCGFALENSYVTKNNGILVYDYGFSATPGVVTHVSLNHLVNEMNFLLEMYITTSDLEYLEVAAKILIGIEDTGKSWINTETGDLHYAYYGDGKYGGQDYPTLTLNDLRYARELITTLYGKDNPVIKMLIETKEKYLTREGIPF